MIVAVDWHEVDLAGAFVFGAVVGTIATIRLTRFLLEYLRRDHDVD